MNLVKIAKLHRIEEGLVVKGRMEGGEHFYGGSQVWLLTENGRYGGCGTATGANILAYLAMTQKNLRPLYAYPDLNLTHYRQHMEEVYSILKPISLESVYHRLPAWLKKKLVPSLGIPGIAFFSKRVCHYASKKGKRLEPVWLDKKKRPVYNTSLRLSMENAVAYIKQGLDSGCPVAMLNGLNPRLKTIEYTRTGQSPVVTAGNFQRHWVAITGVYREAATDDFQLEVASWGYKATLSLQEFWGKGYTGFIYFRDGSLEEGSTGH